MRLGSPFESSVNFEGNVCNRVPCAGKGVITLTCRPNESIGSRWGLKRVITKFSGTVSCDACMLKVEAIADGGDLIGVRAQLNRFANDVDNALFKTTIPEEPEDFEVGSTLASSFGVAIPQSVLRHRTNNETDNLASRVERGL